MMNNEQFPVFEDNSGPVVLQDENTSEAILYGPAYGWIKNVLWIWDEIEEYLCRKADSLDSQIIDREWSYEVVTHNPYLIQARSPPVNEVDHLNDLFTLNSLRKCLVAIKKLKEYRKQNIAWARMKGIENYIKGMEGRGITETEWGIANSSFVMEPITYDTVHGTGPAGYPEEAVDYRQAMMDILGPEEYAELETKILGKIDEEDEFEEDPDGEEEEEDEPEEEEDEPEVSQPPEPMKSEPKEAPYIDELKALLEDPIEAAMDAISDMTDECATVAAYWEEMDVDGRRIIDSLIAMAEA